ncbi:hypothetical protein ACQAYK_01110 [Acidithiobacillus sp. AC3]
MKYTEPKRYFPRRVAPPLAALPFVTQTRRARNLWAVPPANDYLDACEIGAEYAAHYVQYLKDNPESVGSNLLGHIAADIDFTAPSPQHGYWVGFFSTLEKLVYWAVKDADVYGYVDRLAAQNEELREAVRQEERRERLKQ